MAYQIPRLKSPAAAAPIRPPASAPPKPSKTEAKPPQRAFSERRLAPVPVVARRTAPVGLKGVAGPGPQPGKTLLSCVKEELDSASEQLTSDGFYLTKRQAVAQSLVKMAMLGSFAHQKEIMDRENGKVPDRVAGPDGDDLKLYIGMPLDGPNSP